VEVIAEVAGLDREEIELIVDDDVLSIRGQRNDRTVCDHRSFHEARIHYGTFSADIFIPVRVEADAATASYDSGFLRISLPRSRGRTIVPTSAEAHPGQPKDPERSTR
jgi:HSP20 family protein